MPSCYQKNFVVIIISRICSLVIGTALVQVNYNLNPLGVQNLSIQFTRKNFFSLLAYSNGKFELLLAISDPFDQWTLHHD
jgi:hypothetical protein